MEFSPRKNESEYSGPHEYTFGRISQKRNYFFRIGPNGLFEKLEDQACQMTRKNFFEKNTIDRNCEEKSKDNFLQLFYLGL